MRNALDELIQLGREAQELADRLTVPPERLTGCRGTNEAGAVTVELNGAGLVTKVAVAADWRSRTRGHRLGAAVLAAIEAAGLRRLEKWADEVAAAEPRPASPFVPRAADPAPEHAVQAVFELIEAAGREAGAVVGLNTETTTAHSPGRHVTVALTGKQVTDVTAAEAWLRGAHHDEIAHEVHAAIRTAYRAARAHASEVLDDSATARLRELTADPAELLRCAGLG